MKLLLVESVQSKNSHLSQIMTLAPLKTPKAIARNNELTPEETAELADITELDRLIAI
ncbi:hypothetical protein [Spirulina sp. 06S082]|uniref:hypothetical protein n=1 Tax=Spirulina sp. 06S082 TaxID=3110248 RepID=UPI002B21427A|nr:hypothetical protein [Spirulina sp. 06S082]MEA5472117.1 hypothetical protein [Spirulina sp. 06S082]